eukprot:5792522-Alexandrium_andersonii.AAC.1
MLVALLLPVRPGVRVAVQSLLEAIHGPLRRGGFALPLLGGRHTHVGAPFSSARTYACSASATSHS